MAYFGRKQYGNYKTDVCPFCKKQAFLKNKAGISVCKDHKDTELPNIKCVCGNWLDFCDGKYGTYCRCATCGIISLAKVMAQQTEEKGEPLYKLNASAQKKKPESKKQDYSKLDPVTAKARALGLKTWKEL